MEGWGLEGGWESQRGQVVSEGVGGLRAKSCSTVTIFIPQVVWEGHQEVQGGSLRKNTG